MHSDPCSSVDSPKTKKKRNSDSSTAATLSTTDSITLPEDFDGNFFKLFGNVSYVDKTNFIRTAFMPGRRSLITAPSKFGKTNNLLMLQDFLDMRAKSGNTEIYKKMKIYEDREFRRNNFRSHPVMYLDLSADDLTSHSYTGVIELLKLKIQSAFQKQLRFKLAQYTKTAYRELFYKWCEKPKLIKKIKPDEMLQNLKSLVKILRKNCNKEVIVLIDNYDSILIKALESSDFSVEDYKAVLKYMTNFLNILFSGSIGRISTAVITGVSHLLITSKDLSVDNLDVYPFLQEHVFAEYFGVTQDELDALLEIEAFKDFSDKKDAIKKFYGGYNSKNFNELLNPYSVMQCLRKKKIAPYWDISQNVANLISFTKHPKVSVIIDSFLRKPFLPAELHRSSYTLSDKEFLKNMYLGSGTNPYRCAMFLPYFFDQGLLSHHDTLFFSQRDKAKNLVSIKIPNEEVYDKLKTEFQTHIVRTFELPEIYNEAKTYREFVDRLETSRHSGWLAIFGQ